MCDWATLRGAQWQTPDRTLDAAPGMEFSWNWPDSGKRMVHRLCGRSIMNYVFTNQETRKLVSSTGIREDDFVIG